MEQVCMTHPQAPEEIAAERYAKDNTLFEDEYSNDVRAFLAGVEFQKKRAEGLVEAVEKFLSDYRAYGDDEKPLRDELARYREGGK